MKSQILLLIFLLLPLSIINSQWDPKPSPILTSWGENLNPDSVLSKYPRPHMQRGDWLNLNGYWEYSIRDSASGKPTEYDGKILVPFCVESTLSGVTKKITAENAIWYSLDLPVEKPKGKDRWILHFGAVDWHCVVWVNDKPLGEHQGGYDPFSFDITEALNKKGKQNLTLRVWDPTNKGLQARGKQLIEPRGIWYTPVSGIWQTVWLENVPFNHITDVKVIPDVDAKQLHVEVTLKNPSSAEKISITVLDREEPVSHKILDPGTKGQLSIPDAKLWSPDSPFLYDLQILLLSGNDTLDKVRSYFGMRKVELREDQYGYMRIFLNNEALFNYGTLDQGWWPDGLYTAPSDEALKYDVRITKALGFNTARKHTKVEPARWYYWCDRVGLLVWQDMPRLEGGLSSNASEDVERPEGHEELYRHEWEAIINAFDHFPSIICWVPFNEGWGQFKTNEITQWTHELDSTRLVDGPSGWTDFGEGDLLDLHHYPGPGIPTLKEGRAAVLGEFGGLKNVVEGHLWQEGNNWGYRETGSIENLHLSYEKLLDNLSTMIPKGLAAAIYTQTSDVEIEVNGLMTYDRKVIKLDTVRAVAASNKLYKKPLNYHFLLPCSEQSDSISWNYTADTPDRNWFMEDFDDSALESGMAPFGNRRKPILFGKGTDWDTPGLWIRKDFTLEELPQGRLYLNVLAYNTVAAVYVNGNKIGVFTPTDNFHQMTEFDIVLKEVLRKGTNIIAVYGYAKDPPPDRRSKRKQQAVDVGIIEVLEN